MDDPIVFRPVVPEGAGDVMVSPVFGRSVNPVSTKGDRLCPPNNTDTPQFSDLSTALVFTVLIYILSTYFAKTNQNIMR